ncbi:hypothetical protein [Agrococcus lahaulensis]|uniref:hypothetical protein n=1 Tax=Agrococcus lahaulensis TaxID=341722 RepID=UPI00047B0BBE|nr:hypothetical protein [Agrococcus lahaulensis]
MDGHDDDAARWAPPERRAAAGGDGGRAEPAAPSAAAPWTRGVRQPREPVDASAPLEAGPVPVPELPWEPPPEAERAAAREPRMWPIAVGVAALAVLACIPHWVAPTVAIMVALVGIPVAWGFRRISHGRRRVQYIVVVLTLLLTVALSVVAPLLWLRLGVLQPLQLPS